MPNFEVVVNSLVSGFLMGGILALTALGLSITLGVMRLVNLAHGELLVGGSYLGYFLLRYTGIDPIAGLVLVGAAMALMALPFQRLLIQGYGGPHDHHVWCIGYFAKLAPASLSGRHPSH
jgi:branched-chain amino acid transport system permease protein